MPIFSKISLLGKAVELRYYWRNGDIKCFGAFLTDKIWSLCAYKHMSAVKIRMGDRKEYIQHLQLEKQSTV